MEYLTPYSAKTHKIQLSLHGLAEFLLESPEAQASIIETTGSFDVLRLHSIILAHLSRHTTEDQHSSSNLETLNKKAAMVLDRVRIMNVFDLIGIIEAVNEVRDSLESNSVEREGAPDAQETSRETRTQKLTRINSGIADSE